MNGLNQFPKTNFVKNKIASLLMHARILNFKTLDILYFIIEQLNFSKFSVRIQFGQNCQLFDFARKYVKKNSLSDRKKLMFFISNRSPTTLTYCGIQENDRIC